MSSTHATPVARRATGHVRLAHGKRGSTFYAKWREPDGRQVQRRLGPAWTRRGRAPAGHLTRAQAEAQLSAILDAADRGEHRTSGRTFQAACDEWLRHCEHDTGIATTTLKRYRGAVRVRLAPFFGADTPLERITTVRIDAYREEQLAAGRLARRTVAQDMAHLSGIFRPLVDD